MKFVLFVEGSTERALHEPLKRWLDQNVSPPIGLDIVPFEGAADLVKEIQDRALRLLNAPGKDVVAVIALLDLYEVPLPIPADRVTVAERVEWVQRHMEAKVGHPKFRQFLAVHEVEAWLLSDPSNLPSMVRADLPDKAEKPETVNLHEPPGKLLERLYRTKTGKGYRKIKHGSALFAKLTPQTAYDKCPNLKAMLDEMLRLAQEAGL